MCGGFPRYCTNHKWAWCLPVSIKLRRVTVLMAWTRTKWDFWPYCYYVSHYTATKSSTHFTKVVNHAQHFHVFSMATASTMNTTSADSMTLKSPWIVSGLIILGIRTERVCRIQHDHISTTPKWLHSYIVGRFFYAEHGSLNLKELLLSLYVTAIFLLHYLISRFVIAKLWHS